MTATDTIVEHFAPTQVTTPPRLDAWRWKDCVGYAEYRARVLAEEQKRAERRAS